MLLGSILRTPQPKSKYWTHLLQVNNNGVISFDEPIRQCTPDSFPQVNRHPFVIPFWADVDNVLGGDIFYHQTTDLALLEDINQHIIQSFPKSLFTPTWAFVATWDHVAYYGSTSEKAGFKSGDDTNFYNIPGSHTNDIINITPTSNIKSQGLWVFQVGDFQVTGVDPPQLNNTCWL
ncbi:Sushi, nidogen and EGF-like domain-containing protein 1 [Lonchura striata]|uniref:Sushi, nidogen and EGF-like domain-containing protein 1 n=1 Tax=Lonchura striata TaxID=40157 RepID=A0A218UEM1_9PASE|nr:Sushi, nidogen and EGF-like domain-containing protein 1 [Lonchura striata domestica]